MKRTFAYLFLFMATYLSIRFASLIYFFDSSFASFKSWYPSLYFVVFVMVKTALPLGVFVITLHWFSHYKIALRWKWAFSISLSFAIIYWTIGLSFVTFLFLGFVAVWGVYYIRHSIYGIFRSILLFKNITFFNGLLIILIIVGVLVRLSFSLWLETSIYNDAPCRLYISHIWANYYMGFASTLDILNPNIDWLPLHFYFTGLLWKLTASFPLLIMAHTLVGILISYFIYKITRIFSSYTVALIAAVCYLFYPVSIVTSSAIMSEPLFILASTVLFYSFIKLIQNQSTNYAFIYLVSITSACLLRYEAWPLIFLSPFLHFVFSGTRFHKTMFVHLVALIVPLAIMFIIYLQGFHPLRGILYSDAQVAFCYDKIGRTFAVVFNGYKSAIIPGVFIFSIVAWYAQRTKSIVLFSALFLIGFTASFFYKAATFSIMPDDRYLAKYLVLYIPFFVIGVVALVQKLSNINYFSVQLFTLSFLLFCSTFGYKSIRLDKFKHKEGFNNCAQFVLNIPHANFVMDHHHALHSYTFMALADLPFLPDYRDKYLEQFIDFGTVKKALKHTHKTSRIIKYTVNDYDHEFKTTDFDLVKKTLIQNEDVYLILFPEGDLNSHFQFTKEIEIYKGISFIRVFSDHGYLVYKKQ